MAHTEDHEHALDGFSTPERTPSGTPGKRSLTSSLSGGVREPRGALPSGAREIALGGAPAAERDGPAPRLDPYWFCGLAGAAAVQAKASTPRAPAASPDWNAGGGAPLPGGVRSKMEQSFQTDFSGVRVHDGPQADAMGARALTRGTDIYFAPSQYDPAGAAGQELLGHELAHVVQQSQGRVSATTQAKGTGINEDSALEREADEQGARAARGEPAGGEAAALCAMTGGGAASDGPRALSVPSRPVAQGYFTYDGKRQRDVLNEVTSIFQHTDGFDATLRNYAAWRDDGVEHRLMDWFYNEIQKRSMNDHAIDKRGELQISVSGFIAGMIDGTYNEAPPRQVMDDDEGKGTSATPSKSASPSKGGKTIEKVVGTTRLVYRTDEEPPALYVEDAETNDNLGRVAVQINRSDRTVYLHTNAAKGKGGQGLGGSLYQLVMTFLIESKIIPEGYTLDLSIVGGAMLHLQTRAMSERFGNSDLHKKGTALRDQRKKDGPSAKTTTVSDNNNEVEIEEPEHEESHAKDSAPEPEGAKDGSKDGSKEAEKADDLKKFKDEFVAEHLAYLDALVAARRAGKLQGLHMHAQKALAGLKTALLSDSSKPPPDKAMTALFDPHGPEILDLLAAFDPKSPEYTAIRQAYIAALSGNDGVSVSFVLTLDKLKELLGIGALNKLGWFVRKYF